ncbi:hypothetical protein AVL50_18910 [Flammeovirga sp. SJP92]|nr:hypothetical protein AVL50_18910 [Flammeovirga sp. SJP92]
MPPYLSAQENNNLKNILSNYMIDEWLQCVNEECIDYNYKVDGFSKIMLVKVPDCNYEDEGQAMFIIVNGEVKHSEEIEFDHNFKYVSDVKGFTLFSHHSSINGMFKYYFVDLDTFRTYTTSFLDAPFSFQKINFKEETVEGFNVDLNKKETLNLKAL